MSEYNELDYNELPLSEDITTIMEETLENRARKDVYRKHLERQCSHESDRLALLLYHLTSFCFFIKCMITSYI